MAAPVSGAIAKSPLHDSFPPTLKSQMNDVVRCGQGRQESRIFSLGPGRLGVFLSAAWFLPDCQ